MDIEHEYSEKRIRCLEPTARRLEEFLRECTSDIPRIDRISARAKSVDRFVAKANKRDNAGKLKYDDPLNQIQDQIGARIVCLYLQDVDVISSCISEYFNNIEHRTVEPDEQSKFGYFGKHFILHFPDETIEPGFMPVPAVFELQIKTLFQHAWSESEHDLAYKPIGDISPDFQRKIAFTAAQAWGADQIFSELFYRLSAANDDSSLSEGA
jgi:putative GTP pyrophosphokinase